MQETNALRRPIITPKYSPSSKFKAKAQGCMYIQELHFWWQVSYMFADASQFIWQIVFQMTPQKFCLQILSLVFNICRIKVFEIWNLNLALYFNEARIVAVLKFRKKLENKIWDHIFELNQFLFIILSSWCKFHISLKPIKLQFHKTNKVSGDWVH